MPEPQRFPRLPEGTALLHIPSKNIKRLDDPHDEDRFAYECQVPLTEVSKLVIGSANPRKQDLEKPLSQQIRRTLQTEPDVFHLRNRGIWIAAKAAEYDNQKQILTLECPQGTEERYGIVDGGHTWAIIDEFLKSPPTPEAAPTKTAYVMLHIRVGVEDEIEEMAVSLNRSSQLKEYALDDFKGEFNEIKSILKEEPFAESIGYTENEFKEYDVLDLIQRLSLFCVGLYPNRGDSHPVIAYASKAKCLQQFVKNKSHYLALRPIMAECFRLVDKVEVLLPRVSGSERFGGFNFATKRKKPRLAPSLVKAPSLTGTEDWKSSCDISEAVLFPLSAALRVLVRAKADGTVLGWRQDPAKFFSANGRELFEQVRKYYDDSGKSITALGKNSEFWTKLHHVAYYALHPED
jgi:hypothetical protein